MMLARKYLCLVLGVLVFSLFGCGEKEAVTNDASAAPVASPDTAHADEEDDGPVTLPSHAEFLQSWKENCVQSIALLARDKKQDPAKVEPYCSCVAEDVFSSASEINAWLEQAKSHRLNEEWKARYSRIENACMQKYGVTAPHAF